MHKPHQDKGGRKSKKPKDVVGLSGLLGALHEESKPRSNMFDLGMMESYTPPARLSSSSSSNSGLAFNDENDTDNMSSTATTPSDENEYFATLLSKSESENSIKDDSSCNSNGHVAKDMNNNKNEEFLEEDNVKDLTGEKMKKNKSRQLVKVSLKTRTKKFLSGKEYYL